MEKILVGVLVGIVIGAAVSEVLRREKPDLCKDLGKKIGEKVKKGAGALRQAFNEGYRQTCPDRGAAEAVSAS